MDSKLLHMGTYSKQIASHRQTHAHRAVLLDILRENGLSVRVTTTFEIPVVALIKIIKKYPITIGKNFFVPSQDYQWNIPNHGKLRVLSLPIGILTVSSLLVPGVRVSSRNNVPLG